VLKTDKLTFPRISDNLKGILWMFLAALLSSSMVALVKFLGTRIPSYEIVFFRSSVQIFSMMAIFWKIGFSSLKTKRPFLQGTRALLAVVLINCNYYAFTKLPIADATAIGFSRNLFLVILAGLFLHEKITINRLLVTVTGFAGILMISRPGSDFSAAAWVAFTGAGLGATMMILVRTLTFSDSNEVMMTYPAIATVVATTIPSWIGWVPPTPSELFLLVAMSYSGMLGQWCMIQAFRLGETTAVAPASYIRIVYATIIGVYFFSEIPDTITIAGALIIIVSNLFLINQERHISESVAEKRIPGDIT